ncbi:MAG TPA: DNA topoisomerase IV subunit B [Actinobacteria bacterium]|nr:DNA topoisomerase IV subunit B [Actinomycetota bacterium]
MAAKTQDYTARNLSVLEGLEAVRKRPGMYIGSTDSRGLMHCLWEIIDNSVDEALAGHCTLITVLLHSDGSVEVQDNGRGIPIDTERKSRLSGLELVMTKLHAGGKFGGGSYTASGGLHGVGASVVNALSVRLDAQVDRGGKTHGASFRRGVTGIFDGEGPEAEFTKKAGLHVLGTAPRRRTGTRIRWWPDPQVFTSDTEISYDKLIARAKQTAFLVPTLTITVIDQRTDEPREESFHFTGGITEFADSLSSGEPVTNVIRLTGVGHFHETVPVLDAKGHMHSQEVERELGVDIALRWNDNYDTTVKSFVNVIATPSGGTHVAGFERSITKVLNEQLRAAKVLKASEDNVIKDDVLEGMTAVITVRVPEPQFEGQTKEVLGTPAASRIVASVVSKQLGTWFATPPRGSKAYARAALDKVANASRVRLAARQQRDVARRKTALESSALPAKLVDCRSGSNQDSELFIVEGDSALGTAKLARNSATQALLPIRGKILNVQKAGVADMLKNAECAAIIQVIGAGSGRTFDLEAVRYGKIILMADADVDGAHIRCLLLTLVHRYMRPLLEAGRVFAAVPPLHRIEVSGRGGKAGEVIYTYSDDEMRQTVARLRDEGRNVKDPVQRFKGLGEMDSKQLRETTMDPRARLLRRVTATDVDAATAVFDLLMGSEVAPRKDFIVAGAADLDRDRIDV